MASISSKPWTLKQLLAKTPRKIQYNSDDTKVSKAKKIVDKDTGLPAVVAVVYSTHDANGNPIKTKREHRCYIMGLEGIKKPINESQVKLSCDCEFFMYNLEYALSRKDNAEIIFSNGKPATITNPQNKVYLCKHLFHLAEVMIMKGM